MALKPCRECGKQVSTEAKSCPHCGCDKPVNRSAGPLGWLAVGAVGLVVFSCVYDSENAARNVTTPTQPISNNALTPPAPPAWVYDSFADKLDGEVSNTATLRSVNTLEFEFPYNKPNNRGMLILRKNKKSGLNVMLGVDHGQFTCDLYDCQMRVRFDDEAPLTWKGSRPSDHSSDVIFIRNEAAFLKKLRAAKVLKIEPNFFRRSGVVLEFQVANLNWQ
jgi:hypothetical protein